MGQPTHRHDVAHRGLVPTAQLASGTPTTGMVPTYSGTLNAIWSAPAAPVAGIVPLTALADQATATMVGRVAAGSGPPSALSASDARSAMGLGSALANPMTTAGDMIVQTAAGVGSDVAPLGTASSNGATYGSQVPALMIDGNDSTYWLTAASGTIWIEVDLGSPQPIGSFRLSQNGAGIPVTAFILASSPDNSTWATRYTASAAGLDFSASFASTSARYWRITASCPGGWWAVYTLSLFGALSAAARLPYVVDGNVLTGVAGAPAWATSGLVLHANPVGGGFVALLVFDDTAITGGLYLWVGSDYVKVGLATT